eukprot:gb/GECG01012001.1/.p1 GENE.gb/GECG01012001.1/~~gb/GECG01012001.1/.p1  ORF type:complete len:274 (+),score=16.35 gb/GECG01012001.1/:1-822(+)
MESGLGIQTVSNRHSLPAYSFAFRNPIPAYKRFGPGPAAYGASSSIGTRACDGVKKNAPIYKFGTDKTREKAGTERATEPSPSDYQNFHKQTPGHYQVSRHRTAPASSFGLKPPPSKSLYSGPGPNSYNTTWNRTTSRKNTPAYGFGTSTREKPRSKARDRSPGKALPEPGPITYSPQAEKWKSRVPAYTLSGWNPHEQIKTPTASAPTACRTDDSMGKQINGYQRSSPSFSFGVRFKLPEEKENTPGPGKMQQYSTATGNHPTDELFSSRCS